MSSGKRRRSWPLPLIVVLIMATCGISCDRPPEPTAIDSKLLSAVNQGDLEAVRAALKAGADPDVVDPTNIELFMGPGRFRALHRAVSGTSESTPDIVRALLEAGADPDAGNYRGATPLHVAVYQSQIRGRTEVVRLLLDYGADPDPKDDGGETPLHVLAQDLPNRKTVNRQLIELLIERGADVNARDRQGRTPLDMVAWYEPGAALLKRHGGHAGGGQSTRPGR